MMGTVEGATPPREARPLRLFIALDPGPEAKAQLNQGLQESGLAGTLPTGKIRWTSPDDRHLTLRFLGSVPEARIEAIRAACKVAAHTQRAFSGFIRSIELFSRSRGVVVLYAAVDPVDRLTSLAGSLRGPLELLGYAEERRPFFPHITLARIQLPVGNAAAAKSAPRLQRLQLPLAIPFRAEAITLYTSDLGRGRPVYHVVEAFALQASAH